MAKQIDPILARDQLQALQNNYKAYGVLDFMRMMFWILTKQVNSGTGTRLSQFDANRIQYSVIANAGRHNLVGKPRQSGFTTLFLLWRLFLPAILEGGIGCMLISHNGKYASEAFRMVRRAHRLIMAVDPFDETQNALCQSLKDNLLHVAYSNTKELSFDYLDSKILVESAEVEESGQTLTLHHVVADEYARWPHDPAATLANVRGALVVGGTVDKISTANGMGGPYYEDVMTAMNTPEESDSVWHFYPWWFQDEYENMLTREEQDEMLADLTSDEVALIAKMHKDLTSVAYVH